MSTEGTSRKAADKLAGEDRVRADEGSPSSDGDITRRTSVSASELDVEAVTNGQPIASDALEEVNDQREKDASNKDSGFICVDWDGPDDPANPKNFSARQKWLATLVFGLYAIVSPLSSTMIAPCIPEIGRDLHITSGTKMNMVVSIYMAGYIVAPLFLAPMSEVYGRRPIIITANLTFIIFNILCSRAGSFGEIIAFRLLAGLGGAGPLSVGGGALSDVWSAEERGKSVALFSICTLIGPAIGPIAGGFITTQNTIAGQQAWRWVFYLTTLVAAIPGVVGAIFVPETFTPVLLKRKAKLLQQQDPANKYRSIHHKDETILKLIEHALVRPVIMITTQPIVIVLATYLTLLFGCYYIFLVSATRVYQERYNQSIGIASLNYLALAIGFLSGRLAGTRIMDKLYRRLKERNNGKGTPEMRLILMIGPTILTPIGLILWGWSVQERIHWIVADLGALLFGMGIMCSTFVVQSYTIDSYPAYAASALAATTSARSAAAFGFPLFADQMYNHIGYGWSGTILGVLSFLIGGPGSLLLYIYGPRLRAASPYAAGEKY